MRRRFEALCLLLSATLNVFWTEANPFPSLAIETQSVIEAYGSYGDMNNAADGLEVRFCMEVMRVPFCSNLVSLNRISASYMIIYMVLRRAAADTFGHAEEAE